MTVQDHLSPEILRQFDEIDDYYLNSDPANADPRRLEFQEILEFVLGSNHVYFTPPESLRMAYPCLVYELDVMQDRSADNLKYLSTPGYQVTFIRDKADHPVVHKLRALPNSSFSRHFATSGLNHDVFTIYY